MIHPPNNHLKGDTKLSVRIKHSEKAQPNEVRSPQAGLYQLLLVL